MDQPDLETTILQASAVPYRIRKGKPEFCLITSSSGKRWGFPKGIIDPGETPTDTAIKESWEEAGIDGVIEGNPLGCYTYCKWGTQLEVTGLLMHITATHEDWPEAEMRDRRFCHADEAEALIDREGVRELLAAAVERIEEGD
jgi:phosphohistidine phosphatase